MLRQAKIPTPLWGGRITRRRLGTAALVAAHADPVTRRLVWLFDGPICFIL